MSRSLFVALALAVCGCTASPDQAAAPLPGEAPLLTLFLVDGLTQEVFERELAAGRLPNMKGLVDEGVWVKNGVASFPSMTGYGFWPFLTGDDAAGSGVLGLRWLDRRKDVGAFRNYVGRTNIHMNRDAHPQPPTLFERFSTQYTSSFNSYMNRGASYGMLGGWHFTMAKYRKVWWLPKALSPFPGVVPTWEEAEASILDEAIAELPKRPKVQWILFASPDAHAHVHGFDVRYVEIVRMIDGLVGRYREASRAAGQEGERLYALVTDHGGVDVSRNVDLCVELERAAGVKLWRGEATELWTDELDDPMDTFEDFDGVLAVNGNAMNYLYFARDGGFGRPLGAAELRAYTPRGADQPVDLLAATLAVPGVELVAARSGPDEVLVLGAGGEGTIRRSSTGLSYTARGTDPLRYEGAAQALMDGAYHAAGEWLKATAGSRFPYGVARLMAVLAQDDAGDMVVTSEPGVDLAADYELFVGNYRGGHGGLRADQLRVPYVLAGPRVKKGVTVEAATAEDVGATLLELLGVKAATDGRVLSEALAE